MQLNLTEREVALLKWAVLAANAQQLAVVAKLCRRKKPHDPEADFARALSVEFSTIHKKLEALA